MPVSYFEPLIGTRHTDPENSLLYEIVSAAATPANVPPSSNGTEGEDESVIYRRCYECNLRVPYQTYYNQSCHGPCQFCRVNRRHISCMKDTLIVIPQKDDRHTAIFIVILLRFEMGKLHQLA